VRSLNTNFDAHSLLLLNQDRLSLIERIRSKVLHLESFFLLSRGCRFEGAPTIKFSLVVLFVSLIRAVNEPSRAELGQAHARLISLTSQASSLTTSEPKVLA
jgi:hypothetical protein